MKKIFALILLIGLILFACQGGRKIEVSEDKKVSEEKQKEKEIKKEDIDLSQKPNEAGQIMVLMYHNIGTPEAEWVRTPENF